MLLKILNFHFVLKTTSPLTVLSTSYTYYLQLRQTKLPENSSVTLSTERTARVTMANFWWLISLFLLFTFSTEIVEGIESKLKTYIVHVNKPEVRPGRLLAETSADDLHTYHRSFLPIHRLASVDDETPPPFLYSYSHVVSGFAARLTEEDVEAMRNKNGFLSAHPERILSPKTTHSPQFLGLRQKLGFLKDSNFGRGIIIGVLDSGILPDHPSFSDVKMPPPPAKWKGKCEFNVSSCNNKLIGARSFNLAAMANGSKLEPPMDEMGHGTHTASTAAGGFVKKAAALGGAKGTAVGMAPYAHLSIYKVCFGFDCRESDVLAGLDAAVADGVDVLSLSLGEDKNVPFFQDNIAIGSFAAMRKGIFVSCATGNSGPFNSTAVNVAPWVLTVGASTIDRKIVAIAKLGNQLKYEGESLFQPKNFNTKLLRLIYAGSSSNESSAFCGKGTLKGLDVKGKVVLCKRGGGIGRVSKGVEVLNAGGVGMILMNDEINGFSLGADPHVLPATHISHADGLKIKAYINSTTKPVATILFKGTKIGDSLAPSVASFSSRGPNTVSPGILKPDIIGPGVNIIAGWSTPIDNNTNTKEFFNIISGTSMSCPHLSGIAALLKSAHPHWSPAAIKSAIMTSADLVNLKRTPILDERLVPATLFATGAGHVNPSKANDPGLIYDIRPNDYIPYLCGLGYTNQQVSILVHQPTNCTSNITEGQLNYPSFSVILGPTQKFTRRVTNVGEANSSYFAVVVAPKGAYVEVKPTKLFFSKANQIAKYSVKFSRRNATAVEPSQGYLAWVSEERIVRSVISVQFR